MPDDGEWKAVEPSRLRAGPRRSQAGFEASSPRAEVRGGSGQLLQETGGGSGGGAGGARGRGGSGTDLMLLRSLLHDASRGDTATGTASGSGSGAKGRRSRGSPGFPGISASRAVPQRYLQPGAAAARNTCSATVHGAGKRHIVLWMFG